MITKISICLITILAISSLAAGEEAGGQTLRERIRERIDERRVPSSKVRPVDLENATSTNHESWPVGDSVHYLEHKGQKRKYLVHVPAHLNPSRPAPLLVAFHGGGGHAEYMADDERYGLLGKSEREGFVVAFPNGYSKLPGGHFATWNAGGCCGDARDRHIDDVGFVREMVAAIQNHVRIDPAQIFAAGMSNGGMMSHRLACEAADLFRAVASVAGTDATGDCRASRPVPVLHIHAKNDTHVLFNGGAGQDAFRDAAKVMDFVSVPETIARWVQRNRCSPRQTTFLERPGAYCQRYTECDGDAQVQLCVTATGGHSWPGYQSLRYGKEPASQALNATDVIWSFFEGFNRPVSSSSRN